VEELQLFAEGLVGIGPGKFRGLKFAGREVHKARPTGEPEEYFATAAR
jgi:hypothetical protein